MVALLPGETLRTASAREVPTLPVTLAVRRLTDTIGRIFVGRGGIAALTVEIARTLDTTEGAAMGRVPTLLLAPVILDL